jgi:hypothetical protein
MFPFSGSSRNDKKIIGRHNNVVHFLSYGTMSENNDVVAVVHRDCCEDTTIVSDGSTSCNSLANETVDILDLTAYEEGTSQAVVFACDSSTTAAVEAQNFKFRLEFSESDDESSSIIKSVAALEHAKRFTDSETTALTVRASSDLFERLHTFYGKP